MPDKNVDTQPDRIVSDETLLKIAKEVAIKFIEMGRLTPTTFDQIFPAIYRTIEQTARKR